MASNREAIVYDPGWTVNTGYVKPIIATEPRLHSRPGNAKRAFGRPRNKCVALTDTLVTRGDGSQYMIARTRKNIKRTGTSKTRTQIIHERMMALPTIHPTT